MITLVAVAQATREVDELGQGVASFTILRNPKARELFHQESVSYQMRQERASKIKRRRSRSRELAIEYHGLRASDLIAIIEALKQRIAELEAQQSELQAARDAANGSCEALREQNARQLAALTNLKKRMSR